MIDIQVERLNAEERTSSAWAKTKRYIEDRLARLRGQLEAKSIDQREADYIRGQIAELRSLYDLEQEQKGFKRASNIK